MSIQTLYTVIEYQITTAPESDDLALYARCYYEPG